MHKGRKVIETRKWRENICHYLIELLHYRIETWILAFSEKVAYTFYNEKLNDTFLWPGEL